MKYCVFCAANIDENKESISIALQALDSLKLMWELNADATGVYEGSQFIVNSNDGGNTSIWAEDEDIHRLIYSCMSFASKGVRLIYSNKTNKTI